MTTRTLKIRNDLDDRLITSSSLNVDITSVRVIKICTCTHNSRITRSAYTVRFENVKVTALNFKQFGIGSNLFKISESTQDLIGWFFKAPFCVDVKMLHSFNPQKRNLRTEWKLAIAKLFGTLEDDSCYIQYIRRRRFG